MRIGDRRKWRKYDKIWETLLRILDVILIFWEMPQNIAGLLTYLHAKRYHKILSEKKFRRRYKVETEDIGISFGWFFFYSRSCNRFGYFSDDCLLHEYGHTFQSRILGPLYFIIVGIASWIRYLYSWYYLRKNGTAWRDYYDGYPERWADDMGGVHTEIRVGSNWQNKWR